MIINLLIANMSIVLGYKIFHQIKPEYFQHVNSTIMDTNVLTVLQCIVLFWDNACCMIKR